MNILGRFPLRIVCLLGLAISLIQSANSQTLTLQLPINRVSHTFSLWELNADPNDTSGNHMSGALSEMGIPGGFYQTTLISGLNPVGGSIDAEGRWTPALLQGFIDRLPGTTTYFISDDTSGEIVHANTSTLVNAAWVTLTGQPVLFFALPEVNPNQSDTYAVYAEGNDSETDWRGWFPLSLAPNLSWVDANGTQRSYGFREGWAFVPFGVSNARVFNLNLFLASPYSAGSANLADSSLWTPADPTSWPTTAVRIFTGRKDEVFELISPGGETKMLTATDDLYPGVYGVLFSVGFGREFWLNRLSDGRTSPVYVVSGAVPTYYAQFDAVSFFTAPPPPQDWRTLSFRASPGRNPFGWKVRRMLDGVDTPINWDSNPSGTWIYDYSGTNSQWVEWYNGSAYVNIYGLWTVVDASGNDLDIGTEAIDWPVVLGPTAQLTIPRSRAGHNLIITDGAYQTALNLVGPYGSSSSMDPNDNSNYSWDLDLYSFGNPSGQYAYLYVIDQTTGENSQYFQFFPGTQFDLSAWHPTSNLLLKISATRWSHTFEIRCGNGDIFPVQRHQVQGDWSFDPSTAQSWFNSYGFMDASALKRADLPFHLFDLTKGEYLQPDSTSASDSTNFINSTDNSDADGDNLPDWYEHMIGTDPHNPNTDGDLWDDGYEVAHGTNPRAGSAVGNPNSTLIVFTPLE
jgi:hypothetical protein